MPTVATRVNGSINPEKTGPQIGIASLIDSDNTLVKEAKPATNWYTTVRELRKDPTIALARRLSIAPILASNWGIEGTEEAPEGAVELIDKCLQPIRNHIQKTALLGCIDFGWQPYEKIFKIDNKNQTVLAKLKPLLQDLTNILVNPNDGSYAGLRQCGNSYNNFQDIDLKIPDTFVTAWDVEGTNWYGQSILEIVYTTVKRWETVDESAQRYDKKIAGAHWVVHYPIGTSKYDNVETDNFEIAKTLLNSLKASGSIAIPNRVLDTLDNLNETLSGDEKQAWRIELLSASGNGSDSFISRQRYLDALKVRAFGFPERAILEGEFGTKAEAETHGDLAVLNQEQRHESLVTDINWHIVNHLLRLNYGEMAENTVSVVPTPIYNLTMIYMRRLYELLLQNPEGFAIEVDNIDFDALRDQLGIPTSKELTGEDTPVNQQLIGLEKALKISI